MQGYVARVAPGHSLQEHRIAVHNQKEFLRSLILAKRFSRNSHYAFFVCNGNTAVGDLRIS